jgi:hypothetical protein
MRANLQKRSGRLLAGETARGHYGAVMVLSDDVERRRIYVWPTDHPDEVQAIR